MYSLDRLFLLGSTIGGTSAVTAEVQLNNISPRLSFYKRFEL